MDVLAPLIANLHGEGRVRVWSLVITVFGDSVQHRGGGIGSGRLQSLLGRLDVDAGAVRTALSRLTADGWLTRATGRNAPYRLSAKGEKEFQPALARVYAAPSAAPQAWTMAIADEAPGSDALHVAPQTWLCPKPVSSAETSLSLTGSDFVITKTMRIALLTDGHRQALALLAGDITTLDRPPTDPLDALAARTALIHRWRRLILRYPEIPAVLMPDAAPLRDPRRAVGDTYKRLCPLADVWLEENGLAAQAPSPARF